MNKFGLLLGLSVLVLLLTVFRIGEPVASSAEPMPEPVAYVDLERFSGTWYEVAAIPRFSERNCAADTTVEYKVLSDGRIQIIHDCNGGNLRSEGRAEVVDPVSHAKLRATFLDLVGWRFMAARDYWILDVDPDYQYAIVGHPDRKYGWILSRTPCVPKEDLQILSCKLTAQGYNPCHFRMMPQAVGAQSKQELCTYLQE